MDPRPPTPPTPRPAAAPPEASAAPPQASAAPPQASAAPPAAPTRGRWLVGASVARPITVGMMFAALLVLGAIAYTRIPVQLVPEGYDLPFLYVSLPTLPSTPADVEQQVALPTESMLATTRHIRRLRTRVRSDEVSFRIDFNDGANMTEAYNQLRDRLERVLPTLPADVERYFIWKFNPNDEPIYWFGVSLSPGVEGSIEQRYEALEAQLVHRLERIDGVSRVEPWGATPSLVRVRLDEERIGAAGLSSHRVIEQLQADNFTLAAGHLEAAEQRMAVRVMARHDTLDDLRALPIAEGWRLSDLADVSLEREEADTINRVNGRDAVLFGIYKEATANTVDVTAAVDALLEDQFATAPALSALDLHRFRSQGDLILGAIDNLQQTALWGGLFAVIVLLVFIRRVRMTLMIAVGMPLAMLITLVVMYFTGFTLNMLTLMGLMLSVGMVVDNSIVVVENIQRHRDLGFLAREAAIRGAAEVALALVVATATTVIVFLPMILMSGNESLSFYLGKIGFPVCISLVASLFVSLVFIPLASLLVLSDEPEPGKGQGEAARPPAAPARPGPLTRSYRAGLRWVATHRFDALVVVALITASIVIPMDRIQRTDEISSNLGDMRIRISFDPTLDLAARDAYFREVEAALDADTRAALGVDAMLSRVRTGGGSRLQLFLSDRADADHLPPPEEVERRVGALLPSRPGVEPRLSSARGRRGASAGDEATITLQLQGPDSERLAQLSQEVTWRLEQLPEVSNAETSVEQEPSLELHVLVDREQAQQRGLSAALIGSAIDYSLRGRRLPDMHLDERQLTVRAEGDDLSSLGLDRLTQVRVPSPLGGPSTPVELVSRASPARGLGDINREDRQTVLYVQVFADSEDLDALSARIDQVLADFEMPRGYALVKGERFQRLEQDAQAQQFALIMAVLCVFLLMGVLFESIIMPIAIVFSIPFALLGVYWALYLTDTMLDTMAGVGLIILVGIVVNNAIVLIDTINQLRAEGAPLIDAVVDGASRRLRPVLMTALTTICGLIPMAIGDANLAGIPYAPLGRTVVGGLVASTLLTLFVVPLLYLLLEQAAAARRRAFARLAARLARLAARLSPRP